MATNKSYGECLMRPWQAVVPAAGLWLLIVGILLFVYGLFLFPALSCAKPV